MDGPTVLRGVLAGLVATGGMTLVEGVAYARWGLEALLDWRENQAVVGRLLGRPPEAPVAPGLLLHALHGAVAGLAFVVLLPLFPAQAPSWVLGPGYGVVLLLIGLLIHGPITGRAPWVGPRAPTALALALLTHLVYGSILVLLAAWP